MPRAGVAQSAVSTSSPELIERLIVLTASVGDGVSNAVLVDSGATSNFVTASFVRQHGLRTVELGQRLDVRMANGNLEPCGRFVRQAAVVIGQYSGMHDFVVLPSLDGFDVILGRTFLKQARVIVDHHCGSLTFAHFHQAREHAARKVKLAKITSQSAVFSRLVADVVEGLDEPGQDELLQAFGLTAMPSASESTSTRVQVSSAVFDAVMLLVQAYEVRMKPFIGKLPPSRGSYDHAITVVSSEVRPKVRRAIPLNDRHQQALAKELARLLEAGFIRVSRSEWASPVFFVPKNADEDRMVCDFRGLNSVTMTNSGSLPYVKELFARLNGSVIFTKLDLTSGYHQLRVRESDIPLTAFITPHGHFEWVVMPFGEKNAPASFAQLMNQLVLRDLVHSFVIVFQDDMLIASKSDEEHVRHVEQVLQRLSDHELWIKPQKCEWAVREVDFLGHRIRATELGTVIEPLQSKIDAVSAWPVPTTAAELRSFLGLANFYRDFVQSFSAISAPLTALTGLRVPFVWEEEHERAFISLKAAMCAAPALLAVDCAKPFVMHCDASSFAVGAVLSQRDTATNKLRPVAFFSRKLTDTQLRWDVYEREIFSVVTALEHWHFHLKGTSAPVQIFTDHRSLEELKRQLLRPKMARWLTFLSDFNYEVTWIPSADNQAADALSRRPDHDEGSLQRRIAQTAVAQQLHHETGNSLGPGAQLSPREQAHYCPASIGRTLPASSVLSQLSVVPSLSIAPSPASAARPDSIQSAASQFESAQSSASHLEPDQLAPAQSRRRLSSTAQPVSAYLSSAQQQSAYSSPPQQRSVCSVPVSPVVCLAPALPIVLATQETQVPVLPAKSSLSAAAAVQQPALTQELAKFSSELNAVAVSASASPMLERIRSAYMTDSECQLVLSDPAKHGYCLRDGLLLRHNDRGIRLPEDSQLRLDALREAHDQPMSGHMGCAKTVSRLAQSFYWPGMARDVSEYIARCGPCQRNKHSNMKPAGLLKPLPLAGKGEMITIDFVGELPRSRRGKDAIMVVVDKMTKRSYYEPCTTTATAKQTAEMIFRRVVREQGLPLAIVTDRDARFTSQLWRDLWSLCGTEIGIATAYHQQTDGQSERQVRTLEESLRMFVNAAGNDWDERLVHVEIAHNTSRHASTGFAPLRLHTGIDVKLPISLVSSGCSQGRTQSSAQSILSRMLVDVDVARASLKLAQERQKVAYDRRHRDIKYVKGDYAYIGTADTINKKGGLTVWKPRYEGPFRVLWVSTDGLNVCLDIPKSRRHPVFHVSKLKKAKWPLNSLVSRTRRVNRVPPAAPADRVKVLVSEGDDSEQTQHDNVHVSEYSGAIRDQEVQSGAEENEWHGEDEELSQSLLNSSCDGPVDASNEQAEGDGLRRPSRRRFPPERLIHDGRLGDHFGLNLANVMTI